MKYPILFLILIFICSPALAFKKSGESIVLKESSAIQMGLTSSKNTIFGQTHFRLDVAPTLGEKLHQVSVTMYSSKEWVSTVDSSRPNLKNVYRYRYNQGVIKKISVMIVFRTGEQYEVTYDATTV